AGRARGGNAAAASGPRGPQRRLAVHFVRRTTTRRRPRRRPVWLLPDRAVHGISGALHGIDTRRSHHSSRRTSASSREHPPEERGLAGAVGGHNPGGRYDEFLTKKPAHW